MGGGWYYYYYNDDYDVTSVFNCVDDSLQK
jgi:hypothetical protein